ncbi:hypothetical protein MGYG_02798 [Nannizzia gypsea CBS 118893]|uniref:Cystathionine gamma-synthase n=1 Tax=Arthroderma gypseum (strain ATCC MYA-4604 / CBS 118893) TaxID=535722 RepID=E4UP32_ARTGP|nr:hypothetical protein MGYG_02798 [Nannizzia gypsea CBS 118893]EFQ99785.1 hypothetical protein MGYG_02798 [Nannizzia gypsea CBS 118893]
MAEQVEKSFANMALKDRGPSTVALHADDVMNSVTDVSPPIHLSTTFRYTENPDDLVPEHETQPDSEGINNFVYSRCGAPSSTRFETILSQLLNGHCLSYSSGLSALHAALVFFNPRQIAVGHGYHGSHGVINIISRLTGMKKIDLDCPAEQLEKGDLILLETPVNPHGTSFSIESYAQKARSRGAYILVDSTFGPPGLQDPFKWGADMIMHSGTKYLGGHSDMLCGVLATQRKDWYSSLADDRQFIGSVMGSLESWLGTRSLRTLEIRVQRLSQNATNLVAWLDAALNKGKDGAPESTVAVTDEEASLVQKMVAKINHSSLQREDKEWLSKQMPNGYGPVFSIMMKEERVARALPSKLHFFHHATSLGGVESLIEWRAMSDATVERELLRVSVGLENWQDLKDDIVAGLKSFA